MPEPRAAPAAATDDRPRPSRAPARVEVKVSWCKGCGLCVAYCNRGVLEMRGPLPEVIDASRCTRCLLCEAICPDFAITILDAAPSPASGEGGSER